VSVVPSIWISKDSQDCFWPKFRDPSKTTKAIRNCMPPNDSWKQQKVKVKKNNLTYEKARSGSRRAE
ncbi:unnamed protein product, partial [Allacma fusca]